MYCYHIRIKEDNGEYRAFSGLFHTVNGETVATVRRHWEDEMKDRWPEDRFSVYGKDKKGGKWTLLEELK